LYGNKAVISSLRIFASHVLLLGVSIR